MKQQLAAHSVSKFYLLTTILVVVTSSFHTIDDMMSTNYKNLMELSTFAISNSCLMLHVYTSIFSVTIEANLHTEWSCNNTLVHVPLST